jgi:hypothetical protein
MRGADRLIVIALPLVAVAVGFWLLVLAPKQREAGELGDRVSALQQEQSAALAEAQAAEQAKASFARNYGDLVSLGAAVPEEDDQASLIEDLRAVGRQNSATFRSFTVTPGAGAAAAAPAPTTTTTTDTSSSSTDSATTTTSTTTATEADAAALPLGATVGPAGLPVTPYDLEYTARFFDMADVFNDLNGFVTLDRKGRTKVHGRLLTLDGFSLSADTEKGFPMMKAELAVTTYLVPADQGVAAGATPTGPAPVTTTTTSTDAATSTASTPTATVTP